MFNDVKTLRKGENLRRSHNGMRFEEDRKDSNIKYKNSIYDEAYMGV